MEHQTTDQTLRDMIIDRLHELVNDGCYEDISLCMRNTKSPLKVCSVI